MRQYKVLIPCRDDKKKKVYHVGEIVDEKEFSKAVIENFVEIGVLEEVSDGQPGQK